MIKKRGISEWSEVKVERTGVDQVENRDNGFFLENRKK